MFVSQTHLMVSLTITAQDANAVLEQSTWHPSFGEVMENQCLVLTWHREQTEIVMNWEE